MADPRRIPGIAAALGSFLLPLSLAQAPSAWASTFTVNPVQLFLSGRTRSALLTLRNTSGETLRFELSAAVWDQSPQGEMLLAPTRDVVFFPQLLTLAPGDERKVRVGVTVAPAAAEKTYRIFIEELPPLEKPPGSPQGARVRVLTKMGIPIFLQPAKTVQEGRVEAATVRQGRLSFQVRNSGNVHFLVQAIRITGYGVAGEPLLHGELQGWYVLPGGTRAYEVELPPADCGKLKSLTVDVKTAQKAWTERLEIPPSACGR